MLRRATKLTTALALGAAAVSGVRADTGQERDEHLLSMQAAAPAAFASGVSGLPRSERRLTEVDMSKLMAEASLAADRLGLKSSLLRKPALDVAANDSPASSELLVELQGSYSNTKIWLRELLSRHQTIAVVNLSMHRVGATELDSVNTRLNLRVLSGTRSTSSGYQTR